MLDHSTAGANLRVVCHLAGPLDGDAPHLDSLLQLAEANRSGLESARHRVNAASPLPEAIPIPLSHKRAGAWLIPLASSPILSSPAAETVERFSKKIDAGNALLVAAEERKAITATSKGWMKHHWRPHRVRLVDRIVWFCASESPSELLGLLNGVRAIGKQTASGYGRVRGWEIAEAEADRSWFAESGDSKVLMRPLPCDHDDPDFYAGVNERWRLPGGLVGCRRHFGACVAPYWHPERFTEVVVPC